MAGNHILVFLCDLFGYGFCRVVQLLVYILFCYVVVADGFTHIGTERFGHGEEHTTGAWVDGITADVVEITIGIVFVIIIQTIQSQQGDDFFVFQQRLRQIGEIYACGVAEYLDV